MTKQQFIERIDKIEAFLEERRKIGNTLCSLLEDGFGVFTFGQELLKAYIADTAKLSKINKEAIEWFIYEAPLPDSKFQDRTCRYNDGFEMNILTADDLWEFEKHKEELENKKK